MIVFTHNKTGGTAVATSTSAMNHRVVEKDATGRILQNSEYQRVSKDRVVKCLRLAGYDVSMLDTF